MPDNSKHSNNSMQAIPSYRTWFSKTRQPRVLPSAMRWPNLGCLCSRLIASLRLLDMKHPPFRMGGHTSLKSNKLTETTLPTVMLTKLGGMEPVEPTSLVARCAMVRKKRRAEALPIFEGRRRKREEYGMKEILKPNRPQVGAEAGEVEGAILQVVVVVDGVGSIKR